MDDVALAPPDLDAWLPDPGLRARHQRRSNVAPSELWEAARHLALTQTGLLGRLVRWRIPGLARQLTVEELFREPPFMILEEMDNGLLSGLVGRIWTLRRDYPELSSAAEFRDWSERGTARVLFAHWVQATEQGSSLHSEARVEGFGAQGRVGLHAIRPLVRAFSPLVGSEGLAAAVRAAERRG